MAFGNIEFGKSAEKMAPVEAAAEAVQLDKEAREQALKVVGTKSEIHGELDGLTAEVETIAKLQNGTETLPDSKKVTEGISFENMSGLTQVAAAQLSMSPEVMEAQMLAMAELA